MSSLLSFVLFVQAAPVLPRIYQNVVLVLIYPIRPEATFLVRQNVTLPVEGLNFQYKKTGFIPRFDSPKKSPQAAPVLPLIYRKKSRVRIRHLPQWS